MRTPRAAVRGLTEVNALTLDLATFTNSFKEFTQPAGGMRVAAATA